MRAARPMSSRLASCVAMLVALCPFVMCSGAMAADAAKRIVSLAPNLTEIAFAAGAGDRIVGTAEYSDFPRAARQIPRVSDAFNFDYERILALKPDVVLTWEPGTPREVVERLRTLGLTTATIRTEQLSDIAVALRDIGKIAGTQSTANPAADAFEQGIDELRAEYGRRAVVSVFLQINDQPLYTVNGRQIMSELVALCGGRNIFASLNDLAPQIGVEAVIAANPDAIVSTRGTFQMAQPDTQPRSRQRTVTTRSPQRVAREGRPARALLHGSPND